MKTYEVIVLQFGGVDKHIVEAESEEQAKQIVEKELLAARDYLKGYSISAKEI